jgi:virginiamycin B lyase
MVDKAGGHAPTGGRRRRVSIGVILALAFALTIGFASTAQAYVYWTAPDWSLLGRTTLDGSQTNPSFIGASYPYALAVDSQHVYWTSASGKIGRANLDGGGANQSFITGGSGNYRLGGVAVDGQHVYWTYPAANTIGRADLDGTNPDRNFITGLNSYGVTVDAQHIYWTNYPEGTIGRADLDGTNVNMSFIAGANNPTGVAVDSQHIYWSNGGKIGRANLDGTNANQSFIGAKRPTGLALDSQHVYWNDTNFTIARADLDGTNVKGVFIGAPYSYGIAVDSGGPVGGGREQRIVGSVAPHRTTVGDPTCFRFKAEDESGEALRNVRVGFAGTHDRTGGHGRAEICKSFDNAGPRHARLTKRGFERDRVHVKVKR